MFQRFLLCTYLHIVTGYNINLITNTCMLDFVNDVQDPSHKR